MWFRFAVGYMFYSILDTVLRCCPTQDHNFYLILRNTTHITFISILLLYFHIIILIITVNELMKEYNSIPVKKCFICAQNNHLK